MHYFGCNVFIFVKQIKGHKFKQLVEAGLNELNNSALKPEVKPYINEFQGELRFR